MCLRVQSCGFVALGIALLVQSTAVAQRPRPGMQPPSLQKIKTGGAVVSVGQNQLQLSTNMNQTITVMVGPETEISVVGTAERDYLKSGVNVEFTADVGEKSVVKEKVVHLIVFTPTTARPVGRFSSEMAIPAKKDKKDKNDKKNPKAEDVKPNPLVADDTPPAKGPKKPGDKSAKSMSGPGTYLLRGPIKMFKDGRMTVAAGRGATIKAELAEDASIEVDMADIRVAQADDRVTVEGKTSQARPNLIFAESVKIDLANPLTGKKHKPAKTPAGKAKKSAGGASDSLNLGK